MNVTVPKTELTRHLLLILFLLGLILGSLWVLSAFIGAIIWATMIVIATWPIMRGIERRLGNRRRPAVAAMTVGLLLVVFVPLAFALGTVISSSDRLFEWVRSLSTFE